MAKIKLTKGELKRQRDALKRYKRFLPTLQLKKQQLQMEILHLSSEIADKKHQESQKIKAIQVWAGLLGETRVDIKPWLLPKQVVTGSRNIAGVDIPVFERVDFQEAEYDLFMTPLWIDNALELLRILVSLRFEIKTLESGMGILRHELRITAQRVNLFEKVKIPEAEESIRVIKISIGDQMTNAVGRSKIAKKKIEDAREAELLGVAS